MHEGADTEPPSVEEMLLLRGGRAAFGPHRWSSIDVMAVDVMYRRRPGFGYSDDTSGPRWLDGLLGYILFRELHWTDNPERAAGRRATVDIFGDRHFAVTDDWTDAIDDDGQPIEGHCMSLIGMARPEMAIAGALSPLCTVIVWRDGVGYRQELVGLRPSARPIRFTPPSGSGTSVEFAPEHPAMDPTVAITTDFESLSVHGQWCCQEKPTPRVGSHPRSSAVRCRVRHSVKSTGRRRSAVSGTQRMRRRLTHAPGCCSVGPPADRERCSWPDWSPDQAVNRTVQAARAIVKVGLHTISRGDSGRDVRRTRSAKTTLPQGSAVVMEQVVQVLGSLLVLAAFVAGQRGLLDPNSKRYLVLNAVGSAVLAADAAIGQQWGFLLLEGVWALVSVIGLVAVLRGRPVEGRAH